MRWFRSNWGGVAWLAVFALACQFLLSFGHIHLAKYSSAGATWVVSDGGDSIAPPAPPQKVPPSLPDDFCAICASIGLAGALVMPHAPSVEPPRAFVQQLLWSPTAAASAAFDHFLFDARGPPTA
jgi:hypothetical protein